MTLADGFCPIFLKPPIVETILGVQFAPLRGFRSVHFGWFWRKFLAEAGWVAPDDESPIPTYTERFDDLKLKLTRTGSISSSVPSIRMKVRNERRTRSIQLQPDKFYFTWNREDSQAPRYTAAKEEFVSLFGKLHEFVQEAGLGAIEPNLWDVTYVNQIPSGDLWQEPSDWHRVLPSLFPNANPGVKGLNFRTFDGNWHFEIEPKMGRIHVNVAKMIRDGAKAPVMFLRLAARGEIGSSAVGHWAAGLDIGHKSCVELFLGVCSPEAKKEWELRP